MKSKAFLLIMLMSMALGTNAKDYTVTSPDGKLQSPSMPMPTD